jgi:ABC-type enterochelin transport system substrate-binding protein
MKKLLSVVALLSMLALASCNKESTETTSTGSNDTPSVEVNTASGSDITVE